MYFKPLKFQRVHLWFLFWYVIVCFILFFGGVGAIPSKGLLFYCWIWECCLYIMLYLKYLWLTHEINSWTFFVYSWESLGFIKSSFLVKRNDFWIPTYFNRVVLLGYSTISHPSMECQNNIWDIVHTTLKMLWYSLPLIFHLL